MESMSGGCKANNVLTISKDTKGGARGARALTTCENFSTCTKVKFLGFNLGVCWGVCVPKSVVGVESKIGKVENMPIIEDKVVACVCKKK